MEKQKWPNLRELTQNLAADDSREDSPKIKNWLQDLSERETVLLIKVLEPYFNGDISFEDLPSVDDVLRYTDPENYTKNMVGSEKAQAWLNSLSEVDFEYILEHLDMYHNPGSLKTKAALYFSLSEYIFSEKGIILSAEQRLQFLKNGRTEGPDRLGRIENDITHDNKAVIKGNRSEDLSAKSCILRGNFTRFSIPNSDYSASPRLVIDNDRSVSLFSMIQGSFDKHAGQANAHNESAYFFEGESINALLEVKSQQINKVNDKKKHVLKIFNTFIDILYETSSSFVLDNARVIDFLDTHATMIETEIRQQLKDFMESQIRDNEDYSQEAKDVIAKYIFALDVIKDVVENVKKDKYREISLLLGQLLLQKESVTLPLYEAA